MLFRLCRTVATPAIALASALAFATQYAGMEMVVWRHIVPYTVSVGLFGLGLLALVEPQRSRWARNKAIVWFTLGILTHETIAGAVALAAIAAVVGKLESRRRVVTVAGVSVGISLLLNALDFLAASQSGDRRCCGRGIEGGGLCWILVHFGH